MIVVKSPGATQTRWSPLLSSSGSWILLVCILAISGFFYLQNLGSSHITSWDEVVHVNVIKNLAGECCTPRLHRSDDLGTDFRDWTNNTVWLHKPLLPFYLSAISYRWMGHSLWAIRLPGAIFGLFTTVQVFFIGRRFLGSDTVALAAAAIYGLNPYTNELVHGREFAGFPDLELAFFLTVALYLLLAWAETPSRMKLALLGGSVAIAYLCKGGLALAPFAIAIALALYSGGLRELIKLWPMVTAFVVVAAPQALFWAKHYPAETLYENREQLWHLTRSLGGYGSPWYWYGNVLLPMMLTFPIVPFAYPAIIWGMLRIRTDRTGFVLGLWCPAYLIPLSMGVSKVENHIYAVMPVIALLIPHMTRQLILLRRFKLLLAICLSSVITSVVVLVSADFSHPILRFAVLAEVATILLCFLALSSVRYELRKVAQVVVVVAGSVLVLFCAAQAAINNRTGDEPGELALRTTGIELQRRLDKDAVLLAHSTSVDLADLFVMFWSGSDVFDVCRTSNPSTLLHHLGTRNHLYLLTSGTVPIRPSSALPAGKLYLLDGVPAQVWEPLLELDCRTNPTPPEGLGGF